MPTCLNGYCTERRAVLQLPAMGKNDLMVHNWAAMRRVHAMVPSSKRGPGWKLRNWRLQNEVTQTRAARMFGCSQPVLSQYERGERDPHGEQVVEAIRKRTGVTW